MNRADAFSNDALDATDVVQLRFVPGTNKPVLISSLKPRTDSQKRRPLAAAHPARSPDWAPRAKSSSTPGTVAGPAARVARAQPKQQAEMRYAALWGNHRSHPRLDGKLRTLLFAGGAGFFSVMLAFSVYLFASELRWETEPPSDSSSVAAVRDLIQSVSEKKNLAMCINRPLPLAAMVFAPPPLPHKTGAPAGPLAKVAAAIASKPLDLRATKGSRKGGLVWPVFSTRVTSGFGLRVDPLDADETRLHQGVDIGIATGTPVLAAADGTVLAAGSGKRGGVFVRLQHANKMTTLYAHLSTAAVLPGEFVRAGQPIGLSGSTGRATGPHLHFELWKNGVPKDPKRYHWSAATLSSNFALSEPVSPARHASRDVASF